MSNLDKVFFLLKYGFDWKSLQQMSGADLDFFVSKVKTHLAEKQKVVRIENIKQGKKIYENYYSENYKKNRKKFRWEDRR